MSSPVQPAMPAVLVIAPDRGWTYVEEDVRILSRHYRVEVVTRRDYPSRKQFLPMLLRRFAADRYALVYMWFADPYDSPYVVLLARLFRMKCAVVAGGYDVASLPAIGYGGLSSTVNRWKVKTALLGAHVVLTSSHFLAADVQRLGRVRGVRPLYPGVDCTYFTPGARQKERLVVTVGSVIPIQWKRKGLDVFAECSKLLPDVRFVIVGRSPDADVAAELRGRGGENLELTGTHVSRQELLEWYQRAAVYAQLSQHEGFGVAVAEAMGCGCVPVAARVGALPEVVGDAGFLVDQGNAGAAAGAITRAMESALGPHARERVQTLYPLERRERELTEAMSTLLRAP